ncbi:MAG: hypothetical protein V3S19_00880, partial [Gemmatimonadales bacterium]
INCVRVLLSLAGPFWSGFGTDHRVPGFYTGLPGFASWLDGRGVYLDLGLFGDVRNFGAVPTPNRDDVVTGHPQVIAEMRSYARRVIDTLAPGATNTIYSVSNEPTQIGYGTDSAVIEGLCALVRSRLDRAGWDNAPLSCGAQGENEHFFVPNNINRATTFAFHALRDGRWNHLRDLTRYIHGEPDACDLAGPPCPVLDEEAANQGDQRRLDRPGFADGTDSIAYSYGHAVTCRLKRIASCTFHYHGGLWTTVPRPATINSLQAWALGHTDVPFGGGGGQPWNGGNVGTMLSDAEATFNNGSPDSDLTRPLRVHGLTWWAAAIREPLTYVLDVLPGVRTVRRVCDGEFCVRTITRR